MAERLGEALLDLDTNDKGLKKGIAAAEKDASRLGATFDEVSKRAMAMGKTLGLAAAAGAVALGILVKRSIDNADAMSKAAVRAGVTTEELSRLAWAGELSDVSLGSLQMSLGRLSNLMAEMAQGGAKDTAAIFSAMGIEVTDAEGRLRSTADVLPQIADALAGMESGSERTALAMQVFGRSGAELIPMLVGGSAGLKDMADEADRLGKTISTQFGQDAELFNDTITRLGAAVDGTVNKVAMGAIPALQQLAASLTDPKFQKGASWLAATVIGVLNAIVEGAANATNNIRLLRDAFSDVGDMSTEGLEDKLTELGRKRLELDNQIVQLQTQIDRGETGLFDHLEGAMTAQIEEANKQIAALGQQEEEILGILDRRAATTADGAASTTPLPVLPEPIDLSGIFTGTATAEEADKVRELLASLRAELDVLRETDPVQQRLIGLREQLKGATGAQRAEVEALITTIEAEQRAYENAQAAAQFFGDLAMSSIDSLIDGSKSLTDVLGDVTKALAQAVLQSMLLGQGPLAGLFGTQSATGGVGGILGSLFAGMFATGGLIPNGTWGIVGERGPEPVIGTPGGARVLPNSSLADVMGGGRGDTHVTVNGSGLSQAELTEAISDALERFDRFHLPGRVAEIQADPMARG